MDRLFEISSPCHMAWRELAGTGAQRLCAQCNKVVHSLSDLDPLSAGALLERGSARPGGICVRVRCDRDGFVLFTAAVEPQPNRARLRLKLAPAVLGAGLMAACSAPAERSPEVLDVPHETPSSTRAVPPHAHQPPHSAAMQKAPPPPSAPARAKAPEGGPASQSVQKHAGPAPSTAKRAPSAPARAIQRREAPRSIREQRRREWLAEHPPLEERVEARLPAQAAEEYEFVGFGI